jgi:hypothetical protein
MKNIILILITLFCLTSCTQNHVEISDQYVYNGLGGIKCEVDGVLLKPSTAIVYSNAELRFDSDNNNNNNNNNNNINFMSISFHNSNTSTGLGFQSVRVKIMNVNSNTDLKGNVYSLKDEINNESFGNYIRDDLDIKYKTNYIVNGELKVLYHDIMKGKVGGTFWFDAINDEGVIVKVRNGQFDLTN